MEYDFSDKETIDKTKLALEKNRTELSDEEIDIIIAYRSEKKAKRLAESEYVSKLNDLADKTAEYDKKLSDIADYEFELKQKEIELMSKLADME